MNCKGPAQGLREAQLSKNYRCYFNAIVNVTVLDTIIYSHLWISPFWLRTPGVRVVGRRSVAEIVSDDQQLRVTS